jgi:hypothetical protein
MTGADISDLKTTFSVFPMGIHGASVTRGQSRLPPLHRLTHPTPRRDPKHSGEGGGWALWNMQHYIEKILSPKISRVKRGRWEGKKLGLT